MTITNSNGNYKKWKSNQLTLIETRKSRDIQIDNDDKKLNLKKILFNNKLDLYKFTSRIFGHLNMKQRIIQKYIIMSRIYQRLFYH